MSRRASTGACPEIGLVGEMAGWQYDRRCTVAGIVHRGGRRIIAQRIKVGHRALIEAAEREIETLSTEQAVALHGGDDVVFVDIRDIRELNRDGRIPGAFHCPRGMLEFWVDPDCTYHKPIFAEDKRFLFFCAGGLRSALAAQTAAIMGLKPVAHIAGGFGGWKRAGGPVELPEASKPK